MRTDGSKHAAEPPWARLRARLAPARRQLARMGPGPRIALMLAPLGLLAAAAALVLGPEAPARMTWLYNGHHFSAADASRAEGALKAHRFDARVEDGRVGVPAAREADALTLLEKEGLAPRSADELVDDGSDGGLLETPAARERRLLRGEERALGQMIRELDEATIESARVVLSRPPRAVFGPPEEARATVRVTARGDQPLAPATVMRIKDVVSTMEHLKPDALAILDRAGRVYLEPNKPGLLHDSQAHAREEELKSKIQSELDWVEGLKVSVQVESSPPPVAAAHAPAAETPRAPLVVPNGPLDLPADPGTDGGGAEAASVAPEGPSATGKANVLVQYPLSTYLRRRRDDEARRGPGPGELLAYAEKLETKIKTAVAYVVPPAELGKVVVMRSDPAGPPPPDEEAAVAPRRLEVGWLLAGGAGALALVAVLVTAFGMLARRPASRPARRPAVGRHEDASGPRPAPSERVRELVRRDPVAAAGVLQRWIGQGGDSA